MKRLLRLLLAVGGVAGLASLAVAEDLYFGEGWDANPIAWQFDVTGRQVRAKGIGGFAVRDAANFAHIRVAALVTPGETDTNAWATLGVSLFHDEKNFWHAALVQSPSHVNGGRRFFELSEMRDGVWLSHHNDKLKMTRQACCGMWRPGVPCRISLSSSPEGISAQAVDEKGKLIWEQAFAFRTEPAVTVGRPALHVTGGFGGTFAELDLSCSEPRPRTAAESAFPPYASDSFVPGVTDRATGFFRVVEKEGRWWVIDPLGRGMVLLGVDHVTYHGHWSERTKRARHHEFNKVRFPDKADWEADTLARLKAWGFNALGAGCDLALAHRGMVHTKFLSIGDSLCWEDRKGQDPDLFICPNEHRPCSAFPNVFSPLFPVWADYVARQKCAPVRNDLWLFGYFIDNELAWWGRGKLDTGLFDAVAKLPEGHSARAAQKQFLASRGVTGETSVEAKLDFLRLAAEKYFEISSAAIRRHDPNHLVLGARFAGLGGAHPVVWEMSGKYCDLVTFNCYPWADLDRNVMLMHRGGKPKRVTEAFAEAYGRVKRPMLVTEWSFPALDSGLPCLGGAGQRFRTQALRTRATELFARTMLALPFLVGYDYFMWVDEPPEGISDKFPEDSNYGLINEKGVAYPEITQMFTRLHGNLGEVRQAGVPSERQDAAKGVDAAHVLSRMGTPKAAQHVRQGDAYSIRNAAGLELSGRVGGGRIFSTVKLNGRKLGEYTGMWCDRLGEKLAWHENGKVVSADWREEAGRGVLRVTFEVGSTPTRIVRQTQDITVFADRPWFLCSLATLQNVGTEPIELYMFYFREHPAFAIDPDASTAKRVPNLWKEPEQDTWLSIAGDAYFGGCSFAPTVSSIRHWVMPGTKSLHPDAGFVPESPLVLQPAETYDPKGKTWMVAICGLDGKEGWQRATKQIEDVAQLSDE